MKRLCSALLALYLFLPMVPIWAKAAPLTSKTETVDIADGLHTNKESLIAPEAELVESAQDGIGLLNNGTTDYRQWSQADSRWGSIRMGTSSRTIASHGCLVTSITKLIIQAGFRSADSFTVATFANWMNNNTGYVPGSANMYWAKPAECISGFVNCGALMGSGSYSSSANNAKLLDYIKQGYHLAIAVNSEGHWVAVDEAKSIATGTIYIMDSWPGDANADITLAERYSTFNRVQAYKGGSTPNAPVTCDCSTSYEGEYICITVTDNLNIRSGHSTGYSVIGKIPSGATVYVSAASGTGAGHWAHVEYNGISGYASMEYLERCSSAPSNGWSGDVQWTLTADGVLRFYGTGKMKYYGYNGDLPWKAYANQITSIVIEEGVTAIGSGAFKGLTKLESVTLPKTGLETIGEAAFYGCAALKEIYIPDGVYTIWAYTFKGCASLESVRLPKTLIKIDQGAFENCTALPYIFIPTNVEIIGSWSFKDCTGLKEADMQWADATEIREGAFKNCSGLKKILLPANIQVLGDSCFYGIGATSFTVPETVTRIEAWCFARAYSLTEIIFKGNAPVIGEGAFNKITVTAYYPSGNAIWTSSVMQNYGGTVTWKAN